jgi:hypothetical protein
MPNQGYHAYGLLVPPEELQRCAERCCATNEPPELVLAYRW